MRAYLVNFWAGDRGVRPHVDADVHPRRCVSCGDPVTGLEPTSNGWLCDGCEVFLENWWADNARFLDSLDIDIPAHEG